MTYGYVVDVPAPIEMYDALHAEITRRAGASADGLLVHVGRQTSGGFQILEVWESKEQFDRFNDAVIRPAVAELTGGQQPPEPAAEEFEPRGLILSGAQVFA